jgi:hypothetical protein
MAGLPRLQEDSFVFGRIVSDAESGTLNAASVLLEGDAHLSEGVRCPLDLSQLPSFRLFPGQVRSWLQRLGVSQLWLVLV